MSKIDPNLVQQLQTQPDQPFDLIVRTDGDPVEHAEWCQADGITVTQTFRLTPGVAVSATGRQALKLLTQDWVISVELDRPVQAL